MILMELQRAITIKSSNSHEQRQTRGSILSRDAEENGIS
jgi:hypothetical protein